MRSVSGKTQPPDFLSPSKAKGDFGVGRGLSQPGWGAER